MKTSMLLAALTLAAALPAHAAVTFDVDNLGAPVETIDFEAFDGLITTGPEAVASTVTFSGGEGSVLGAFIADLGDNGLWGAGNLFAASSSIGELRFTFNDGLLSSGAGAVVNHFALSPLLFSVQVSAFGATNELLETYTMVIDTAADSLNQGLFLGIVRDQADIRSISYRASNGMVLDDFSFTTPVPEPGTYALLLAGLAAVGFVARRRRG
jgi:hypothetical protein